MRTHEHTHSIIRIIVSFSFIFLPKISERCGGLIYLSWEAHPIIRFIFHVKERHILAAFVSRDYYPAGANYSAGAKVCGGSSHQNLHLFPSLRMTAINTPDLLCRSQNDSSTKCSVKIISIYLTSNANKMERIWTERRERERERERMLRPITPPCTWTLKNFKGKNYEDFAFKTYQRGYGGIQMQYSGSYKKNNL